MKWSDRKHINDKNEAMEYFINNKTAEPCYCSHFGCGKRLDTMECLCGDKCADHSKEKKMDATNIISGKY